MSTLEEQNPEAKIATIEAKTKTLEEQKLEAEIAKIKAETEALSRSLFLNPRVWISLVGLLLALATTTVNWIGARTGEQTAKAGEQIPARAR